MKVGVTAGRNGIDTLWWSQQSEWETRLWPAR